MSQLIDFLTANTTLIALLVGLVVPPLTSVIQQPSWSRRTRTVVAVIASIVIGFITAVATGAINDASQLVPTLIAVLLASEAAYQKFWAPSGISTSVEVATSPSQAVLS